MAPVSLIQPGVLRLVWEAPGLRVRPGLGEAVAALGIPCLPEPPQRDWHALGEHELGEHILELYDQGRYEDAVEILRERGGAARRRRRPAAPPIRAPRLR